MSASFTLDQLNTHPELRRSRRINARALVRGDVLLELAHEQTGSRVRKLRVVEAECSAVQYRGEKVTVVFVTVQSLAFGAPPTLRVLLPHQIQLVL